MKSLKLLETRALDIVSVVFACLFCTYGFSQQSSLAEGKPSIEAFSLVRTAATETSSSCRFWSKKNSARFATAVALSAADFVVTRANLQNGGRELNPVVRVFGRSTQGLAVNFAGQTAGVIGVGYLFHKTGHHKLERITFLVNIGASGAAVAYGLRHR